MTHYDIAIPQGAPVDDSKTFALSLSRRLGPLLPILHIVLIPMLLALIPFGAALSPGSSTVTRAVGYPIGVVDIILGVGFILSCIRAAWKPVTISPKGVTICNITRFKTVPMADVAGFDFTYFGLSLRLTVEPVVGPIRNPRSIGITALNTFSVSNGSAATPARKEMRRAPFVALADEMNAELDRLRGTDPSTAERLKDAKPALRSIGWHDDE